MAQNGARTRSHAGHAADTRVFAPFPNTCRYSDCMAGPSPYKRGSFGEVFAVFREPIYVVCYTCKRYIVLSIREHGDRDSRKTTFSCCVCGGEGRTTSEKPVSAYREDARANAARHPKAIARLTGRPARGSLAFRLRERSRR